MAHIDYYFGTGSGWAYLAGDRLEQIAARHDATITYKPLDLLQLFDRTGGTRPAERHASRKEYRMQEMRRWADHLGMPMQMNPAFWPVNTAPSSYAIIAAQEAGGGDLPALVQAFLRACWAEDQNIADDAVIRATLSATGFDPALTDKIKAAFLALDPAKPADKAILDLQAASRFIPTKAENYTGIEEAARAAGLLK